MTICISVVFKFQRRFPTKILSMPSHKLEMLSKVCPFGYYWNRMLITPFPYFIEHIKSKHGRFLSQQQSKVQSRLQQLQQVDKDIRSINNIIEEGNLVKDGSIAFDLAYQDKTLQEWLDATKENL